MTAKYFCGLIMMTHLCIDLVVSLPGRHANIQKYSNFRQTGSGDAADLNCPTLYSSPYWCFVPNIRKLAFVVPEKYVTEIILWPQRSLCNAGDTITVLNWNTVTNWYINISTQTYWQGASSQHRWQVVPIEQAVAHRNISKWVLY